MKAFAPIRAHALTETGAGAMGLELPRRTGKQRGAMTSGVKSLLPALGTFLADLESSGFSPAIVARMPAAPFDVAAYVHTLFSEATMALSSLEAAGMSVQGRVLEVGAGGGLLSTFLHQAGADIRGIEPIGDSFEPGEAIQAELGVRFGKEALLPWRLRAAELQREQHGLFDLIFSVNVLEHMQPLAPNLDGMARVLKPDGAMWHLCPNYRVPYEPHYSLPLVPGAPAWTAKLAPKLADDGLWRSLNFITPRALDAFAERNGLVIAYAPGLLSKTIERIEDPAFAARHGAIGHVARVLRATGATALLRAWPARWATPMEITVRRAPAKAGAPPGRAE